MAVREEMVKQIEELTDDQLRQVADYLSFVRYKSRVRPQPEIDEEQIARLYAEFADEDRELAEEGLEDYAVALKREDAR